MVEFKFVKHDEDRMKAVYVVGKMKIKGFISEHGTDGLYWFNTEEGIKNNNRDILVSAQSVKILIK